MLAVVTVDTVEDLVDFDDGKTSLREAIFATNLVAGRDEIRFDASLFAVGSAKILLTQGELPIADELTVSGLGADLLTIDANLQSRIFNINSTAGETRLSGLTLTRGRVSGNNQPNPNDSTFNGGAIRSISAGGISLEDVVISQSGVTGQRTAGGGLFAVGPMTIAGSVISGNFAEGTGAKGGGVAGERNLLSIIETTIAGNRAPRGGGVHAFDLALDSSTVNNNCAVGSIDAGGGGLLITGYGTIFSSTISTNSVEGNGDSAAEGGGVWTSGFVDLRHSTVITNTASSLRSRGIGGGAYVDADGAINLDHTIVAGNLTTEEAAEISAVGISFRRDLA